jgi:hypothetical protein
VKSSWTAQDAAAEVCGVITIRVSLNSPDSGRGLLQFISHTPMSFSARHELILILERLSLLSQEELKSLRTAIDKGEA